MTNAILDAGDLRRILIYIADEIRGEEARLNALDAAVGDGDHGITMRLGFQAVKEDLMAGGDEAATISSVLERSGQVFMSATGGAIGVVLGRMLISSGTALRGISGFGAGEFKAMLEAMETAVISAGNAKPGDKTILDAVHTARKAVGSQQSLADALRSAAEAAAHGAERTADMICRVGRGSRLGERTLGHPDPGAVTFSIILRAFSRYRPGTGEMRG